MTYQDIIDKYYPAGSRLRDIYMRHCRSVADLALNINRSRHLGLPSDEVEEAAMLHDIGIFLTDAPGIGCTGKEPYIRHGVLGAALLRNENMPERDSRVAERHTGAGISAEEINEQRLPLDPNVSYMPATKLERLVCYADKFYSKSGDMKLKPLDKVKKSMERISEGSAMRFQELIQEFGDPALATLTKSE
ncbi:MAG: HDIG domain-containing protein [Staphylococcus sp.]|nr:HDIG domain-containing protein [Staphylococcus sp.]